VKENSAQLNVVNTACQRFVTLSGNEQAVELVLFHGWGFSSVIWQQWLPELRQQYNVTLVDLPGYGANHSSGYSSPEQFIEACMASLPTKAVYLGFSLGGMLVSKIAERYPQRVQALVTISSNVKFIADKSFEYAMPEATFASFSRLVEKNPQAALRRFLGLQAKGGNSEKLLLGELKKLSGDNSIDDSSLVNSLQWLEIIDNRGQEKVITAPTLKIFSKNDVLVPVSAAEIPCNQNNSVVRIIDGASHASFLSHQRLCSNYLNEFLLENNVLSATEKAASCLHKSDIAKSFSKAAATYDRVAVLQRAVGKKLLAQVPTTPLAIVVDMGCGTGYFSEALSDAAEQLIGIDLAEGMVDFAKKHHQGKAMQWLCADNEQMPLLDSSVDLVFSSLSIQWSENLEQLFAEVFRVLKPGGTFLFSSFGPETLKELKHAWGEVDDCVHVNRFAEKTVLLDALHKANFEIESFTEELIVSKYPSLKALTSELKGLGAHNVNAGRPEGLMGKNKMKVFINAYSELADEQGLLPASYQLWYGQVKKQHA
jgi:malonyl-CoA O-methyltransferase